MLKTGERLGSLIGSLGLHFCVVLGVATALVLRLHRASSIKIAKAHETDTL
jgi:hypothetical protein